MTLKVNYGYFSSVGGIAGNVLRLYLVADLELQNLKFRTSENRRTKLK